MKFDIKQSYGEVYGHPNGARYEQNGRLFTPSGDLIGEPVKVSKAPAKPVVEEVEDTTALSNEVAFLLNVLSGGAMSKSKLFREVEQNNLEWDAVRNAAPAAGVRTYRQGSTEMWRLNEV